MNNSMYCIFNLRSPDGCEIDAELMRTLVVSVEPKTNAIFSTFQRLIGSIYGLFTVNIRVRVRH